MGFHLSWTLSLAFLRGADATSDASNSTQISSVVALPMHVTRPGAGSALKCSHVQATVKVGGTVKHTSSFAKHCEGNHCEAFSPNGRPFTFDQRDPGSDVPMNEFLKLKRICEKQVSPTTDDLIRVLIPPDSRDHVDATPLSFNIEDKGGMVTCCAGYGDIGSMCVDFHPMPCDNYTLSRRRLSHAQPDDGSCWEKQCSCRNCHCYRHDPSICRDEFGHGCCKRYDGACCATYSETCQSKCSSPPPSPIVSVRQVPSQGASTFTCPAVPCAAGYCIFGMCIPCVAGDTEVTTNSSGPTRVEELAPNDWVRGSHIPDGTDDQWCRVLYNPRTAEGGTAYGPTTATHLILAGQDGDQAIVPAGTRGTERIVDLYNPVTTCPFYYGNDTVMTSLAEVMFNSTPVSISDYVEVFYGLLAATNSPDLLGLWNPAVWADTGNYTVADPGSGAEDEAAPLPEKLWNLSHSILACRREDACEQFEAVADDLVTNHLEPNLRKVVKDKYPSPRALSETVRTDGNATVHLTTTTIVQIAPPWFFIAFIALFGVCVLVVSCGVFAVVKRLVCTKNTSTVVVGKSVSGGKPCTSAPASPTDVELSDKPEVEGEPAEADKVPEQADVDLTI